MTAALEERMSTAYRFGAIATSDHKFSDPSNDSDNHITIFIDQKHLEYTYH
jgi:hypothetical protein